MLVRTRPSRPLFDRSFDRAFEQLTSSFFNPVRRTPVIDASWQDGTLELTVDLPGTPADKVGVSVAGRTLTLSATSADSTWERSLRLGAALDPDQVSATYLDGRLTVTVSAAAGAAARQIEIVTPAPAVEAASDEPAGEAQPENGTSDNA